MKVLVVHNSYKQPGGEDLVVQRETVLLRGAGQHIVTYLRHNEEIDEGSLLNKIRTGSKTIWARDSYRQLAAVLRQEKPDLAHFHNTFPLISPSAYYACLCAGVPVVQTLHNYRLFCPAATFFRNASICEECVEHSLWHGIKHRCYKESHAATAAIAVMLSAHRLLDTWRKAVSCFIAVSEFVRGKFIAEGFPADRVVVKPNFVDPDPGKHTGEGKYAIFVGRLSAEKGVRTLIRAWAKLEHQIPLLIVGEGPLRTELEGEVTQHSLAGIKFQGYVLPKKAMELMTGARFLVFPSEWYETFGMTIAEAFACGVPVVCSRSGAMQELVNDNYTGLHFTAGDAADLATKVKWAWTHTEQMESMGRAARHEYEAKYTASVNYRMLTEAYEFAVRRGEGLKFEVQRGDAGFSA